MTWFDHPQHKSAHHAIDEGMAIANIDPSNLTQQQTMPPDLDSVANYRLEQVGAVLD